MAYNSCSICFETMSNYTTNCEHHYCNECITSWLLTNNSCPICRKEFYHITEDEAVDDDDDDDDLTTEMHYYIGNIGSNNREFLEALYLEWFMEQRYIPYSCAYNMMKQKLPKNVNYKYHTKHYRFDNTNYNQFKSRY
jgi:hypothetical protein